MIVLLTVALLIVIFFFTCNKPAQPETIVQTRIKEKEVIKQVGIDSVLFAKEKANSDKKISALTKTVSELKGDLNAAQGLVVELLNDAPVIIADTSKFIEQLAFLKLANATKDSICNSTIAGQDSIINAQAEAMVLHLDFQAKQRESINDMQTISKEKDSYVKYWKKKYRKTKAGNTALKIVAIVAAAVAVKQSL